MSAAGAVQVQEVQWMMKRAVDAQNMAREHPIDSQTGIMRMYMELNQFSEVVDNAISSSFLHERNPTNALNTDLQLPSIKFIDKIMGLIEEDQISLRDSVTALVEHRFEIRLEVHERSAAASDLED